MLLPTRFDVDFSAGEELVDYRCERCGEAEQRGPSRRRETAPEGPHRLVRGRAS